MNAVEVPCEARYLRAAHVAEVIAVTIERDLLSSGVSSTVSASDSVFATVVPRWTNGASEPFCSDSPPVTPVAGKRMGDWPLISGSSHSP